jgi:hypothetical protein
MVVAHGEILQLPPALKEAFELPFEVVDIAQLPPTPDNKVFSTVKIGSLIRRLNDTCAWSLTVVGYEFLWQYGQVIAHVRLHYRVLNQESAVVVEHHKDGIGMFWLKTANGANGQYFVDPANDLKAAVSDGLKKAASYAGLAYDLYDKPTEAAKPQQQAQSQDSPSLAPPFMIGRLVDYFETQCKYPRENWTNFFGFDSGLSRVDYQTAAAILSGTHPIMGQIQQATGIPINTGMKTSNAR